MKKLLSIILMIVMFCGVVEPSFASEQDNIKVMVNGDIIEFDQQPIIINNRVLVPMRAIFEALGATIFYEQSEIYGTRIFAITDEVIVQIINGGVSYCERYHNYTLSKQIDRYEEYLKSFWNESLPFSIADCDGVQVMTIGGRTLVPLRAISSCLGAIVEWDEQTKTVNINKDISTPWKTEEEIKQMDSFFENFSFDDYSEWMTKEGWVWNNDKYIGSIQYFDKDHNLIGYTWGYDFYGAYVKMPIKKIENEKILSAVTFYYDGTIHVSPWSQGH